MEEEIGGVKEFSSRLVILVELKNRVNVIILVLFTHDLVHV